MEKREVYTIILAVLGVCILMGIIGMIRGDKSDASSEVSMPEISSIVLTTKTDYWDYLREQQATTTTTDITDETGIYDETGLSDQTGLPEAGTGISSESAFSSLQSSQLNSGSQSQSSSTTSATTLVTSASQGGYTLIIE